MKSKLLSLIVFISFCSLVDSTTWHIKQDGSGDYTTIQEGIDASVTSDTILVYPGVYYENLNMNEKNITLASLELTTGNSQYINSTIIDGQRQGSCLEIQNINIGASIQGFTIRNGFGTDIPVYAGGGILVHSESNLNITNCILLKNMAVMGGAICSFLSEITLSGLKIIENSAGAGGGIYVYYESTIIFDPDNLCDIYNNNAGKGYDLYADETGQINVIVDTFSVNNPDRFFAEYLDGSSYTFDIQNNFMELELNDLYVSVDGDDDNSGLTPEEPLKNISWAVRKIHADEENHHTIHVAAGTYSWENNQQVFPIGCKEYVSVIGENAENTIITNDVMDNTFWGSDFSGFTQISNFTIQNNPDMNTVTVMYFYKTDLIKISNIIIQNCDNVYQLISNEFVECEYENVTIRNNNAEYIAGFGLHENTGFIKNSLFENNITNQSNYGTITSLILDAYDDFVIENCKFINNNINSGTGGIIILTSDNGDEPNISVSNCLFSENYSNSDKVIGVYNNGETDFINCTFANNHSDNSMIKAYGDVSFQNGISWNNTDHEIYMVDETSMGNTFELNIGNSVIKNGEAGIYNQNNANIINWNEGNIDDDPLFLLAGDDPYQLTEFSPSIDTGTPDTTGLFLPPWDLLNNLRVWDGDGNGVATIDMGCYEFDAPPNVGVEDPLIIPDNDINISNYPNPFNPTTTIAFNLNESGKVKVEIFNIKGQKVKTLLNCTIDQGFHELNWIGENEYGNQVSSGVYFYCLKTQKQVVSKKMILLK